MKKFISDYFSVILLCACGIGFIFPDLKENASIVIPVLLGIMVFSAFFQAEFSKEIILHNARKTLFFYLIRLIVIPLLIYAIFFSFSKFYATVLFLLLMLPVAIASPTFTNIFKGNFELALSHMFWTNGLAPLIIPIFCAIFLHNEDINRFGMFRTILLTIILPAVLHFPLRNIGNFRHFMKENNTFVSIFCVSLLTIIGVAKYRNYLFEQIAILPTFALISVLCYATMYVLGYFLSSSKNDKIANIFSSGANNIGLGLTLTILYFEPKINLFFMVSQIIWAIILIPVKFILSKSK